jgi:uncharacterized protein YjbJ (UPF0337 family)
MQFNKEHDMDDDRIEGTAREFGGKVQGAAGDLLGDAKMSTEGRVHEAVGKLQENYGAAADQIRGLSEELAERVHESPLLAVLASVGIGYLLGRLTAR